MSSSEPTGERDAIQRLKYLCSAAQSEGGQFAEYTYTEVCEIIEMLAPVSPLETDDGDDILDPALDTIRCIHASMDTESGTVDIEVEPGDEGAVTLTADEAARFGRRLIALGAPAARSETDGERIETEWPVGTRVQAARGPLWTGVVSGHTDGAVDVEFSAGGFGRFNPVHLAYIDVPVRSQEGGSGYVRLPDGRLVVDGDHSPLDQEGGKA